jgi:hypothetical protein
MTDKTPAERLRRATTRGTCEREPRALVESALIAEAADALDAKDVEIAQLKWALDKSRERRGETAESYLAEIARWKALLIERDGGNHDADCRIHNWPERGCSCGHLDVIAALRK